MKRILLAIGFGALLIATVVALLMFAHSYAALEETRRCAPSIWTSQWPKWIGCAMAAHENLAGGLIGAAGALFAAWLAFSAVQQQIMEERKRRERFEIESKLTAVMAITHPVHAAAATLRAITNAIAASAAEIAQRDNLVALGTSYIQAALDQVIVREIVRDMNVNDRLVYIAIASSLGAFVNISARPSPILNRVERLTAQREHLLKLRRYLRPFDDDLATVL